jgi:hypothetical protein
MPYVPQPIGMRRATPDKRVRRNLQAIFRDTYWTRAGISINRDRRFDLFAGSVLVKETTCPGGPFCRALTIGVGFLYSRSPEHFTVSTWNRVASTAF